MKGEQGITLLETILVVALLALLLRLSFPLYQSLISERRVDRVAQDIAGLLRSAQQSAVGDSVDGCYRVQVRPTDAVVELISRDAATRDCVWAGPSVVRSTDSFPGGVTVTTVTVAFTSAGGVDGGSSPSITVSSGGHSRTVSVQGQTGRVQIGP